MFLKKMSVKAKFLILLLATVAAFGAFGAITYRTVDRVKVEGPLYAHIVAAKDLTADILPPPEYILESYLTALKLTTAQTPVQRDALATKLAQLRKDFEDRQEYWKTKLPAGQLKEALTAGAAEPARRFYQMVEQQLVPLVKSGKLDAASELMNGDLTAVYEKHRAAIDELVSMTANFTKDVEAEAVSELSSGWKMLAGTSIGALAVLGLVSMVLTRSVTGPLGQLRTRMKDIAEGEGDLTTRLSINSKDEIGAVAASFNKFVEKMERLVAEVKSGAVQIDGGGVQIASASQSLAQGASEQASSLQEISASLEQISGQTQQCAENSRQASSLGEECMAAADKGKREMTDMSSAVAEINQSSAEVSKIIKVIDEIAFQTNLLALNAAVEAARAGEAGKGFAVVAEEVRNLAQRSAEAAKNTSAMIEESVKRSSRGTEIAGRVGKALDEIERSTTKVNALLREIAVASAEQATGIGQISQGVSQLDQVTQQNAGNSEELASSAEEMASQVASLSELVKQFKVSTDSTAVQACLPNGARKPEPKSTRLPVRKGTSHGARHRSVAGETDRRLPIETDDVLATF